MTSYPRVLWYGRNRNAAAGERTGEWKPRYDRMLDDGPIGYPTTKLCDEPAKDVLATRKDRPTMVAALSL